MSCATVDSIFLRTQASPNHQSSHEEHLQPFDQRMTEIIERIGLTGGDALQASATIWPGRIQASPDPKLYIEWHNYVCPGGSAHHRNRNPELLLVRGESVNGLAHALINKMDFFYGSQMYGSDSPLPSPSREHGDKFTSLGVFFKPLRCYLV